MKKTLLITVVSFFVLAGTASANMVFSWNGETFNESYELNPGTYYTESGGDLQLRNSSTGEVLKAWTSDQWDEYAQNVRATSECIGRIEDCASEITENKTQVEGATKAEAENGQDTATKLREAGTSEDAGAVDGVDFAAETGGELPLSLGADVLGGIALGPTAFEVGVELGNGLDQLFGLAEWHPLSESEEKLGVEEGLGYENQTSDFFVKTLIAENSAGDVESEPETEYPPGEYVYDKGLAPHAFQERERIEKCTEGGSLLGKCGGAGNTEEIGTSWAGPASPPSGFTLQLPQQYVDTDFGGEIIHNEIRLAYKPAPDCPSVPEEPAPGLVRSEGTSISGGCKPIGVPAPGLITPTIEKNNESEGLPPRPKELKPVVLPIEGPSKVKVAPPSATPLRPKIEENEKEKEKSELEEHGKTIPIPGTETADQYHEKLETEGFTNISQYTVSETAINPKVGPHEVADVTPSPGTKVKSEQHIVVAENPEGAPPPKETGAKPSTTVPAIKWPKIETPCNIFPFGVPCWLYDEMGQLEVPREVPVINFEVLGKKVELSLAPAEPAMEIIRPAFVFVSLIALVVLLYGFASGGGAPASPSTEGDTD